MKRVLGSLIVTAALAAASPASATFGQSSWGFDWSWIWGPSTGGHDPAPTPVTPTPTPTAPTDVPEPSDAALVLMGVATLFAGRKLQARRAAKRA